MEREFAFDETAPATVGAMGARVATGRKKLVRVRESGRVTVAYEERDGTLTRGDEFTAEEFAAIVRAWQERRDDWEPGEVVTDAHVAEWQRLLDEDSQGNTAEYAVATELLLAVRQLRDALRAARR
jgi:hypothetical protein